MPMPTVDAKLCGLPLKFHMLRWTCPVHGSPDYAGKTMTAIACEACKGNGYSLDDGDYEECEHCGGEGHFYFCSEPTSSSGS